MGGEKIVTDEEEGEGGEEDEVTGCKNHLDVQRGNSLEEKTQNKKQRRLKEFRPR